ncbi:MAG: lipoprotein [Aquabacterium sp.]
MNRKPQILGSGAQPVTQIRQTPLNSWVKAWCTLRRVGAATALAALCVSASGCGQKGALYLPAPAATASSPSSTPSP